MRQELGRDLAGPKESWRLPPADRDLRAPGRCRPQSAHGRSPLQRLRLASGRSAAREAVASSRHAKIVTAGRMIAMRARLDGLLGVKAGELIRECY